MLFRAVLGLPSIVTVAALAYYTAILLLSCF